MKLLLDENLPKKLKSVLKPHITYTVSEMNWNGLKNGVLLSKILEYKFDALLTFDKNIQYQQNFQDYPICVIIIATRINTFEAISVVSKDILQCIEENNSGCHIISLKT